MARNASAEFAFLERLPPADALAYLQGRGLLTVTTSWQDLWQEEHARQFTISRLTRLDLLAAIRDGITQSVGGDLSRRDWTRDTRALLQRAGWWGDVAVTDPETGEIVTTRFDSARLRLIFDTNVRMAYAAGQWQRIERARATHPYIRYITRRDERVREQHQAWDNVTLPIDDAFWREHMPPNGWRCRCRVTNMTRADYERQARDGSIKTQPPPERAREFVNRRTGEITRVPDGIDPGFAYNPGMNQRADTPRLVDAKLAAVGPELAEAAHVARLMPGIPDFDGQRPDLFALPPVRITELAAVTASHDDLMRAAQTLFEHLRQDVLLNDDSGWVLSLNRAAYKKIADNAKQSDAELRAVAALKQLARRAIVVERHADIKHGNEYVPGIFRLYAPLRIGDHVYRVKLTVKDFVQGGDHRKLLHALDAIEIENAPLGTFPTSVHGTVGTGQPTARRFINIADLLDGVTLYNGALLRR